MPTPSDDALQHLPVAIAGHGSCPPDYDLAEGWRTQQGQDIERHDTPGSTSSLGHSPPFEEEAFAHASLDHALGRAGTKTDIMEEDDRSSPAYSTDSAGVSSPEVETKDGDPVLSPSSPPTSLLVKPLHNVLSTATLSYESSSIRMRPTYSSSFLRAGSKFVGTQQSDKQIYNVEVNIKHVDLAESFLCGYLRIEGLTKDHPTLTTYFEGEIIGPKYTFQTKHENWGATGRVDMQHWNRFPAWGPLRDRAMANPDFQYKNCAQRENIFMRWKEYFLVPDHRVREISGASFEGFYYICFNQIAGTVSGIYFHARSEKFQELELKHVSDKGCFGAIEFR